MNSYYNSDEEVAWGPLTLKEIKKVLGKKSKKIRSRQTDFGHFNYLKEMDTKSNTSTATSAYFTPDESLQTESSSNKNEQFLEKLSKVIQGETNDDLDSSYVTAVDTSITTKPSDTIKPADDTILKILNTPNKFCDIDKIQQTLIENSVYISSVENTPEKLESTIEELSDYSCSESEDNVIVISDTSSDELPNEPDCFPAVQFIKSENCSKISESIISHEESVSSINDELMLEVDRVNQKLAESPKSDSSSFSQELQEEGSVPEESEEVIQGENEDLVHHPESEDESLPLLKNSLNEDVEIQRQETGNIDEKLRVMDLEDQFNISGLKFLQESFQSSEDKISVNSSSFQSSENRIPENSSSFQSSEDRIQENSACLEIVDKYLENPVPSFSTTESDFTVDSLNKSDSLIFDDTLEEIEMALRQGLDYVMPGDESRTPSTDVSTPSINEQPNFESAKSGTIKKQLKTTTSKKYDYVQSCVGEYIRNKSPGSDNFKLPSKPPKTKTVITPNRSPLVPTKHFKNIVSPVGIYINSPRTCLKKNVQVKTVPDLDRILSSPLEVTKGNKENIAGGLPEVVYKPAKKTVASEKKDIVLPSNIKKLVPEMVITKHEKRINNKEDNNIFVTRKLLEEDLTAATVDCSLLNQTSEDVSFIIDKQAFIK